jgi:vacuolar protein sorting-associated protein 26
MASLFGFGGTSIVVNISLNGADSRDKAKLIPSDPSSLAPIYSGQDPVTGTAEIVILPGKKVEHLGIKIELIGQIGIFICAVLLIIQSLKYYF